jgi:hypothetical protein
VALFIGWGEVVRGREARALEVFNEAVAMYGRMQGEGRIESFDTVLLGLNGTDTAGFFLVHGSDAQIDALRRSDDWMRNMADASMIVDGMRAIEANTGDAVGRQMGIYADAIAKVGQKPLAASATGSGG